MMSRFGFSACGVAKAEAVDASTVHRFSEWLASGMNGDMVYMSKNEDKRLDPCRLLPSARSVIVVALNYYPAKHLPAVGFQFPYYAYGKDYHDVMRKRMTAFAHSLRIHDVRENTFDSEACYRGLICCDTVPVLDRYWAWKSGIGWIGKNTSLIIPGSGSFFFIGEIITDMEFSEYDSSIENHCGSCRQCIEACPTGALCKPYILDSNKCLSFLTIENRGELTQELASKMGKCIYGCDRCQLACPHNRFAQPTDIEEFNPSEEFMSMQTEDWKKLSKEEYERLFSDSAVKRAKYEGLMRNINQIKWKNE
jgi:epoxyqueuosine reductase